MGGRATRRRSTAALVLVWMTIIVACSDGEPSSGPPTYPLTSEAPTDPTTSQAPATTTIPPTTTIGPAECVARAPLFRVIGQLVLATASQESIADLVDDVVRGHLGGVVLVGDATVDVFAALAPLDDAWPPAIVAVDEEGGTVQRLAAILGDQPSARDLAESGDPNIARAAGAARGAGAVQLGFTMVLAPVLDVGSSARSTSRSYGDDAETVLIHGLAYAEGLLAAGVVPVAKHFPGHGTADADSHVELPSTSDLADLREVDLVPFEAALETIPAVMIGHLDVPGLTEGAPATLSAAALDLLRDELGFDGLVVTDDLSMGALSQWSVAEAAELAIAAGNDLLIAGDREEAVASADRLAEAVASGRLDRARVDEAVLRVLDVKGVEPCELWNSGTGSEPESS